MLQGDGAALLHQWLLSFEDNYREGAGKVLTLKNC